MQAVTFTNTTATPALYVAQSSSADIGWSAFLLLQGAPTQATSLTLAEAWKLQDTQVYGVFLFAEEAPSIAAGDFITNVYSFLSAQTPSTAHQFMWMQAPDVQITSVNSFLLATYKGAYYYLVADNFNVPLGNFATLTVSTNVILDLSEDGNQIRFTYYNYFAQVLFAPGVTPGTAVVDVQSYLNFSGDTRGCFSFGMQIQDQSILNGFGVSFRYFYPGNTPPNGYYELSSPIFAATSENPGITFSCCVDPLDAFNSRFVNGSGILRTYLAFVAPEGQTLPVLTSSLRCATGEIISLLPVSVIDPVTFQPVANCARLVLQQRCMADDVLPSSFVPAGDFSVVIKNAPLVDPGGNPRVFQFLPGLSGIETISFYPQTTTYAGDVMRFIPGSSAYSANYPFPDVSVTTGDPPAAPLLSNAWQTVALNILSTYTTLPQFGTQPAGAPLYAPAQGGTGNDPAILGFFGPGVILSQQPLFTFPLSAYGNLAPASGTSGPLTLNDYQRFESQVLSASRKQVIRASASQQPPAPSVWSTMPQGLIAEVDASGNFKQLELAQNTVNNQFFKLAFLNLVPELQSALQSNQLFLVATQNRYLGTLNSDPPVDNNPYFQNEMSIDEWAFQVNTGMNNTFSEKSNVIIFKFCEGKITDRVRNPGKWEDAKGFNVADLNNELPGELTAVSQWLQNYFADAETQYAGGTGNKLFEKFITIINDPDWNGILILKADLDLQNFPPEIQGILAGMDLTRLNGHHLGIEVSRVANNSGVLEMVDSSSIFGLINYIDVAYQAMLRNAGSQDLGNVPVTPARGVDYDFKVLTLQVLFENTHIKDFRSKIQVTLNKIFADKVTLMNSEVTGPTTLNSIVMNGTYQRHGDASVYIFDETGSNLFDLAGNVLTDVEIVKVQFNTLQNSVSNGNTMVNSRFTFWGYMNFAALMGQVATTPPDPSNPPVSAPAPIDIFSFGSTQPSSTEASGLYFSNLYVEMQFPLSAPSARTFNFSAGQMAFDPTLSPPRPQSLFPSFALVAAGLIQPDAGSTPSSLGYLPVQAQGLSFSGLGDSWFGLNMTLNLGSPGALAGEAGFTTSLLLAWGVGGQGTVYPVSVGLKLPGAGSNAKMLSIQGVLKLTVGSIQLWYVPTESNTYSFLLQLNRIALSFLGLLKLPPGGNTSFFLFGNPTPGATVKSLGWYAAWVKDQKKSSTKTLNAAST